jgi:hypothetical protein
MEITDVKQLLGHKLYATKDLDILKYPTFSKIEVIKTVNTGEFVGTVISTSSDSVQTNGEYVKFLALKEGGYTPFDKDSLSVKTQAGEAIRSAKAWSEKAISEGKKIAKKTTTAARTVTNFTAKPSNIPAAKTTKKDNTVYYVVGGILAATGLLALLIFRKK